MDLNNHFAAADEGEVDDDLPWPSSCWLEGDTLAPPCSSDITIVSAMLSPDFVSIDSSDVVIDLGAGDGRVCIQASILGAKSWGIEIDTVEVEKFQSNIIKFGLEDKCQVTSGDLTKVSENDLIEKGVTVISLYLLPEAIQLIRPLLDAALKRNIRIVANTWGLPWIPHTKSIHVGSNDTPLFLYEPNETI
mmetsp:Transcript_43122/g.55416  ORF Transcript_43122/g.55416 Transcript_43122/m.55416 type:complete len:191 (-) Transcript_43122:361-933(-)